MIRKDRPRSASQQSPVTVRMSAEERAALDQLCEVQGMAISQVMREALRPHIEPHLKSA